ncbi:hypothetical protein BGW42_003860 [Actinomortierella wolfii]|nr:hypothetical protein BGW42_003860 [Actinomortierella wolfii]
MTVSDTKTNSAVSHNGPMQHNDPSHNASSQISSTTTHTQVKGHRRGSSLPALRHLEQMGRDSAQYEDDSEDDDGDDDHGCLDTPHDNSDLDDFVKGFCDTPPSNF